MRSLPIIFVFFLFSFNSNVCRLQCASLRLTYRLIRCCCDKLTAACCSFHVTFLFEFSFFLSFLFVCCCKKKHSNTTNLGPQFALLANPWYLSNLLFHFSVFVFVFFFFCFQLQFIFLPITIKYNTKLKQSPGRCTTVNNRNEWRYLSFSNQLQKKKHSIAPATHTRRSQFNFSLNQTRSISVLAQLNILCTRTCHLHAQHQTSHYSVMMCSLLMM